MRFPLRLLLASLSTLLLGGGTRKVVSALNGDTSKLTLDTYDGWKAFEVITQGDTNGEGYTLPGELDGIGAFLLEDTVRVLVNHETGRACDTENYATVTEVNLDLFRFKEALRNMIRNDNLGGVNDFVRSFRRAYDTIIDASGNEVSKLPSPNLRLFCSSQAYGPKTLGNGEGFADEIYIFGEERKQDPFGRLFAIDPRTRMLYLVSGAAGDASSFQGGNGGVVNDSFENVALIRTFEKDHVALLMSMDGGSKTLKLYVGKKNRGKDGSIDTEGFLERAGLAFGSWFYLNGTLPLTRGQMEPGLFDKSPNGALMSDKFEDVDTSPLNPTRVVLGDEKYGVFVFDFALDFAENGNFQPESSSFSVEMVVDDEKVIMKQADNVAWTAADLIYIASDGSNGAVWQMNPDGSDITKVASSKNTTNDYNPSGVVDISKFVGFEPASILLADTMSCGSSMAVLINPIAEEILVSTDKPTTGPTNGPTYKPTAAPADMPKATPTDSPVALPTDFPVAEPTDMPEAAPTDFPVALATDAPISNNIITEAPSTSEPFEQNNSIFAFCRETPPCDSVFGIPFFSGEQLHAEGDENCSEMCMFQGISLLFLLFGWSCGSCDGVN